MVVDPPICVALYGNWERIDVTEMTGNVSRTFLDPVFLIPFGKMAESGKFMIFDISRYWNRPSKPIADLGLARCAGY